MPRDRQFMDGPSRRIQGEIIKTGQGVDIHILNSSGISWEVWINVEGEIFDGVIIGLGDSELEARADAAITLSHAIRLISKEL